MEILVFTLNAAFVYLFSDWLVKRFEQRRGSPLKYRQAVFFAIFLALALGTFHFLRILFGAQ